MKNLFFDTESIGFVGATQLIQYSFKDKGEVFLHSIFDEKNKDTLSLIESFLDCRMIAYNIAHDSFHLAKTYTILKKMNPNSICNFDDYRDIDSRNYNFCLNPHECLDLMISSRRLPLFQLGMKQHSIYIRAIPRVAADQLISVLSDKFDQLFDSFEFNPSAILYGKAPQHRKEGKGRFTIEPCTQADLVDIKIEFFPRAGLKQIYKALMSKNLVEQLNTSDYDDEGLLPKIKDELLYDPHQDFWSEHILKYQWYWKLPKPQEYARNDVLMLQEIYRYLPKPDQQILDHSRLAWLTGQNYLHGYAIDQDLLQEYLNIREEKNTMCRLRLNLELRNINKTVKPSFNSPNQIKDLLVSKCKSAIEKILVINAKKVTLKSLTKLKNESLSETANLILTAKNNFQELRLLRRLSEAKRLYCTFNTSGTTTNRSSGGDSLISQRDRINPQGIPKGELRKLFTFADPVYRLSNGDFSGFEVAIFAALHNDPVLIDQLNSGKSIHAIWGSYLFQMTYEDVLATSEEKGGIYSRSKNSFFAMLYGAQADKIALITGLTVERIRTAMEQFFGQYHEVKKAQEKAKHDYSIIDTQNNNFRFKSSHEYKDSISNMFGYQRFFTFEWSLCQLFYDLADNLFEDYNSLNIMRKNKLVTGTSALRSALLGTIFSIQASVQRIAGNCEIQATGAEITKSLQCRLNDLQPQGIHPFFIKTFNVHDEIECTHKPELTETIDETVLNFILEYKKYVPLLEMEWKKCVKNWSEK